MDCIDKKGHLTFWQSGTFVKFYFQAMNSLDAWKSVRTAVIVVEMEGGGKKIVRVCGSHSSLSPGFDLNC
jgi:hypothetical protein